MFEYVQLIGPVGIILVALSTVSLYLTIKNGVLIYLVGKDFKRKFERIENGTGKYRDQLCGEVSNPLINIIACIVKHHSFHSEDLRAEVAYLFHRNFEKVNRSKTVASASATDSSLLAAGIWEALLTTIIGLAVAIPTLIAYYLLSLKMKGFHIEAVEHSYRAVELFKTTCPASPIGKGAGSANNAKGVSLFGGK